VPPGESVDHELLIFVVAPSSGEDSLEYGAVIFYWHHVAIWQPKFQLGRK
jgi:hypothetical protein